MVCIFLGAKEARKTFPIVILSPALLLQFSVVAEYADFAPIQTVSPPKADRTSTP